MPTANEIALSLAEALPQRGSGLKNEIVATGMLMTALIVTAPPEERAELVELVCVSLRHSVAVELN